MLPLILESSFRTVGTINGGNIPSLGGQKDLGTERTAAGYGYFPTSV